MHLLGLGSPDTARCHWLPVAFLLDTSRLWPVSLKLSCAGTVITNADAIRQRNIGTIRRELVWLPARVQRPLRLLPNAPLWLARSVADPSDSTHKACWAQMHLLYFRGYCFYVGTACWRVMDWWFYQCDSVSSVGRSVKIPLCQSTWLFLWALALHRDGCWWNGNHSVLWVYKCDFWVFYHLNVGWVTNAASVSVYHKSVKVYINRCCRCLPINNIWQTKYVLN